MQRQLEVDRPFQLGIEQAVGHKLPSVSLELSPGESTALLAMGRCAADAIIVDAGRLYGSQHMRDKATANTVAHRKSGSALPPRSAMDKTTLRSGLAADEISHPTGGDRRHVSAGGLPDDVFIPGRQPGVGF